MSKRFPTQEDIDAFLAEPRLAMLIYNGARSGPTGVPVWFDWNGNEVQMFSGRTSRKIEHLKGDPNISVLVTNRVGEQEGWIAFDGKIKVADFAPDVWPDVIDRIAPKYWDLSDPARASEIDSWRSEPQHFVSLVLLPSAIRSGA